MQVRYQQNCRQQVPRLGRDLHKAPARKVSTAKSGSIWSMNGSAFLIHVCFVCERMLQGRGRKQLRHAYLCRERSEDIRSKKLKDTPTLPLCVSLWILSSIISYEEIQGCHHSPRAEVQFKWLNHTAADWSEVHLTQQERKSISVVGLREPDWTNYKVKPWSPRTMKPIETSIHFRLSDSTLLGLQCQKQYLSCYKFDSTRWNSHPSQATQAPQRSSPAHRKPVG